MIDPSKTKQGSNFLRGYVAFLLDWAYRWDNEDEGTFLINCFEKVLQGETDKIKREKNLHSVQMDTINHPYVTLRFEFLVLLSSLSPSQWRSIGLTEEEASKLLTFVKDHQ